MDNAKQIFLKLTPEQKAKWDQEFEAQQFTAAANATEPQAAVQEVSAPSASGQDADDIAPAQPADDQAATTEDVIKAIKKENSDALLQGFLACCRDEALKDLDRLKALQRRTGNPGLKHDSGVFNQIASASTGTGSAYRSLVRKNAVPRGKSVSAVTAWDIYLEIQDLLKDESKVNAMFFGRTSPGPSTPPPTSTPVKRTGAARPSNDVKTTPSMPSFGAFPPTPSTVATTQRSARPVSARAAASPSNFPPPPMPPVSSLVSLPPPPPVPATPTRDLNLDLGSDIDLHGCASPATAMEGIHTFSPLLHTEAVSESCPSPPRLQRTIFSPVRDSPPPPTAVTTTATPTAAPASPKRIEFTANDDEDEDVVAKKPNRKRNRKIADVDDDDFADDTPAAKRVPTPLSPGVVPRLNADDFCNSQSSQGSAVAGPIADIPRVVEKHGVPAMAAASADCAPTPMDCSVPTAAPLKESPPPATTVSPTSVDRISPASARLLVRPPLKGPRVKENNCHALVQRKAAVVII